MNINDERERPDAPERPAKKCEKCGSTAVQFNRYCGADVCNECGHHQKMVNCFCGWSHNGGDGYRKLIEDGETIEPI